jgi:hypothetical protein
VSDDLKPTEQDILVEFERNVLAGRYREYYANKRHNLFATIQQFPYLWNCFTHLDQIFEREFSDTQRAPDPHLMFPLALFMNAHSKMRIAFELGCCTCLSEAYSILRDSIESAAHGHRLASDPQLLKPWIEKNDSETAKKVFKQEFEHNKATQLFDGLPELHKLWGRFSEFGSHTNINSIASRFATTETTADLEFQLHYVGGDPNVLVPAIFDMILAFSLIERTLFDLARTRFELDPELVDMRARFDKEKEATRALIIKTFGLSPPSVP